MTIITRLLPAAAIAIGCAGCGGDTQAQMGDGGAMPPTEVQTITLTARPVRHSSEFIAAIHSLSSTTIQPQVEGFVRQILVRSGDHVRAGQALVQIDPDKQRATVTMWESTRAAREADVAFAAQQLARLRTLHEAGAVSRAELEQAETAHATAQAQLNAIQSQIRESQVELQYYRVTAPASGIVGDIPIRPGDRVTPATVITTIDSGDGLEVHIDVPLEHAADLRPGLQVELLGHDGQVTGSHPITFIAPRARDDTQSVLVKAALRTPPAGLRVMQYVRARIVWRHEPELAVPVVAVNRVSGQYFVFVVESGQGGLVARQKAVTLGELVGEHYVIEGGLAPGARVIVSNIQKLGDGAPVRPVGA